MTDYERIREALLARRYSVDEDPPRDEAGVYALFLTKRTVLTKLPVRSDVLYVGMTESSLEVRNHFDQPHSGFSSPRRSLGALLKDELQLRAVPRSPGPSRRNITNFRFWGKGEQRLTGWMKEYLTYGFCRVEKGVRKIESRLIKELEPPLNLTGWQNPQRGPLRTLRRVCRDEARSWQRGG